MRIQSGEPIEAKDLVWTLVVLRQDIKRSWRWKERREGAEIGGRMGSQLKVFRSRTAPSLKNQEKNFEFNTGARR